MSEAIEDPVAFTRLTDQVLQQIQLSTDPNLQKVLHSTCSHGQLLRTSAGQRHSGKSREAETVQARGTDTSTDTFG